MPPTRSSRRRLPAIRLVLTVAALMLIAGVASRTSGQIARNGWTVVAWNNLGMHCMDADFGVFSILPPYNTIQAQVVNPEGRAGDGRRGHHAHLRGRRRSDRAPSTRPRAARRTSGRTCQRSSARALPVDAGLATFNMPGSSNPPQPMTFDPGLKWFIAEGIPITPYDDAGRKNYYPMMKVTAKDAAGTVLASTRIVLPVSDEMDCSLCHASGSNAAAKPSAGWVSASDPQREFRLNILRRHDDGHLGSSNYQSRAGREHVPRHGPLRHGDKRETDPVRALPFVRGAARQRHQRHQPAHRGHARQACDASSIPPTAGRWMPRRTGRPATAAIRDPKRGACAA